MPDEQSQSRRFDDMKSQIDSIAAKQDATSRNVYKILALLEGDDFADGMVSAVKDHEKRLKNLEELKSKATWTILGMSVPSGYGLIELFKRFLILLAVLTLFTSCMTQKKREDAAYRHFRENPTQLAKLASIHYPVQARQGKVTFDTLRTVLRDTIDCPDSTRIPCPPCEQQFISGFRVDTVPDLALVAALEGDLKDLQIKEAVLQSDNEHLTKKNRHLIITVIGLGIALLGAAYLIFKP